MQTKYPKIWYVALAIGVISFCVFATQLVQIVTQSQSIIEEAKAQTLKEAEDASEIVEVRFQNMIDLASSISKYLSSGKIAYHEITNRIGQRVFETAKTAENKSIGLTVAFAPGEYYDSTLYAPYFRAPHDSLEIMYINEIYDYTIKDNPEAYTDWYTFPMKKGACWTEPHFGRAGNALFAGYQLPFYHPENDTLTQHLTKDKNGKAMAGVVCADYRLDGIWEEVSQLGSGKTSYGFLITPNGVVVSYPMREYLGQNLDELELSKMEKEMLVNLPKDFAKNPAKLVDNQWVFYQKVPSTGWILGIVYSQDEMLKNFAMSIRQKTMTTTVAGVISLIAFTFILFGAHRSNHHGSIWAFSTSVAVISAIGMVMIWYLSMTYANKTSHEEAVIYNETNVHSALGNLGVSDDQAKYIPTGFFVQTVEFQGANNLLVNGYIWQKYDTSKGIEKPEDDPEIFFPESESAEYDLIQESENAKMWEFTVILRQPFSYATYPFDSEDIWLRVRSKGFDNHVYLTPDLSAYQATNMTQKPGIADDLILGDWICTSSYYSYRLTNYNSNLGFKPEVTNVNLVSEGDDKQVIRERFEPELFFNLAVQRDFMSPFIGEVVPIMVVAFLVFAILLTQSRDSDKMELTGFNSSSVLGYCASLYFVLIVSHVYTREKLASGHIVYIEYFYFVMYFILLWISLMSLLFVSDDERFEIWNRHDGFLLKVLYWPLFFGIMFIVTFIEFY